MIRSLEQSIYFTMVTSILVLILEAIGSKGHLKNLSKPHIKWLAIAAMSSSLLWLLLDIYSRFNEIRDQILLINHLSCAAIIANSIIAIFIGQKTIKQSFQQGETYFLLLSSISLSISIIALGNFLAKMICLVALMVSITTIFIKTLDEDRNIEIGTKLSINTCFLLVIGTIALGALLYYFGSLDLVEIEKKIVRADDISIVGLLLMALMFFVVAGIAPFHFGVVSALEGGNLAICFHWVSNSAILCGNSLFLIRQILSNNKYLLERFDSITMFALIISLILLWLLAMNQSKWRCTIAYISLTLSPMFCLSLLFGQSSTLSKNWFFFIIFLFVSLCAFIIFSSLSYLAPLDSPKETWEDIAGLGKINKGQSFCLLASLAAIVGLPGTLGYVVKLSIMDEQQGFSFFNILIFTSIALGSALIMRIFVFLYAKQSFQEEKLKENPRPSFWLFFASVLLLVLGFLPAIK